MSLSPYRTFGLRVSSPLHDASACRVSLNNMTDEMEVDVPDQRGTKRPAEEPDASGPAKPKRIKVRRAGSPLPVARHTSCQ